MKKYCYLLLCLVALCSSFVIYHEQRKPTIFLIGDSTVRHGSHGNGDEDGRWGWGSFLHNLFDTTKVTIENRALGGTSSRSYVATGLWEKTLARIKPGDFVIMQFGHNDNGKNTVKGNGDDTIHAINPKTNEMEVIHSFGWNMRKYMEETKAKGATPIVCSLVPRNRWTNGKVNRDDHAHGEWARLAAEQEGVAFIDLNTMIADHYDQLGQDKVLGTYFTSKDPVHTIEAGAKMSAYFVVEGLKKLKNDPLKKYILKKPADMSTWQYAPSKDYRTLPVGQ
ncbi:lysophospholipase L1-like esterase [Mucilaginibacter yixingensis]|uniref:Lysophospholipase L1-like esterase n=1 Tax=Mucilaginibacter yixingensis TaxID=1295612 RepID=A0A2T5JG21_9SPHI|nr:rhamnogalacturonan acetylesterase [Mucilaginibacter yixingensis]PTR01382.1 lysophospholipase L1-like esterase [Mucilaginibacter yixingensis]